MAFCTVREEERFDRAVDKYVIGGVPTQLSSRSSRKDGGKMSDEEAIEFLVRCNHWFLKLIYNCVSAFAHCWSSLPWVYMFLGAKMCERSQKE